MPEADVEWHGDFAVDASGDLMLADGDVEVRQRLERRLFTAVQGYVWHPEYGAGLPQKIGEPLPVWEINAIVKSQLSMEASVAPSPPCQLRIAADKNEPSLVSIAITYWDAVTGVAVSFTVTT